MKWTKDAPTVPGYYWARHPEYPTHHPYIALVECIHRYGDMAGAPTETIAVEAQTVYEGWDDEECRAHEWAGPIPEPEDE